MMATLPPPRPISLTQPLRHAHPQQPSHAQGRQDPRLRPYLQLRPAKGRRGRILPPSHINPPRNEGLCSVHCLSKSRPARRLSSSPRSSSQSTANSAQERFPASHAPPCPRQYPRSIPNGAHNQEQRDRKEAEDRTTKPPNRPLLDRRGDLAAQNLRSGTTLPRAATNQIHGISVPVLLSIAKVHVAGIQLLYHRRPLRHPCPARKVPSVRMLLGKCQGHIQLARSHYDHLLGQVCH